MRSVSALVAVLTVAGLFGSVSHAGQGTPGAVAPTEAPISRNCIEKMLEGRELVRKAPKGEVQLADNCGVVINQVELRQPVRATGTKQICRREGHQSALGVWHWLVVTCEDWGYNGSRITWHQSPPSHRYGSLPPFSATRLDLGVNTSGLPDRIEAHSSTLIQIGLPPHLPVSQFEVNHRIIGYSDGSGETDMGPAR